MSTVTTYALDPDQFGALMVAAGLVLLFMAALLVSSWGK